MKNRSIKKIIYKDYLDGLKKEELGQILKTFEIKFNQNYKKEKMIALILDNYSLQVTKALSLFQTDELQNLKIAIKKKGKLKLRTNYVLMNFLKNLERHGLVIEYEENLFYFPEEILKCFIKKIKDKETLRIIKDNTREYNFILGFVTTYGVTTFDFFYDNYAKDYKLTKDKAYERCQELQKFYEEFNLFEDKKGKYIANKKLSALKECKKYLNNKTAYACYTNQEIIDIQTFKYFKNVKSYKKLIKFISKNYYLDKANYKTVNKYVLIPYLTQNQVSKEEGEKLASVLIDKYFEFNNDKHKARFMKFVLDIALDYPSWDKKGNCERN